MVNTPTASNYHSDLAARLRAVHLSAAGFLVSRVRIVFLPNLIYTLRWRKTTKISNKDNLHLCRDSKRGSPEYKPTKLPQLESA